MQALAGKFFGDTAIINYPFVCSAQTYGSYEIRLLMTLMDLYLPDYAIQLCFASALFKPLYPIWGGI